MIYRQIVIAPNERGLVLKDKRVHRILEPGKHRVFGFGLSVEIVDLIQYQVTNASLLAMLDSRVKADIEFCEQYLNVVDLSENEIALVHQRGVLKEVLRSGQRFVVWADAKDLSITKIDTKEQLRVDPELASVLARKRGLVGLADLVYPVEVNSRQLGLLWVDGKLLETLSEGLHVFWKVNRTVKAVHVELRLQTVEISGQEILTKDKVSLRINLSASYQFSDAERAHTQLQDCDDFLYRKLQFALRESVGTKSLDALLADKEALNTELFRAVVKELAEYGIKVQSVGVKDIILPGEMKEILNHVVATEKAAQANVIRRREETAATRSLLNTAKLMDENPTLLRLKEIEALEKVVEKVDRISVYDGLNGLMKDTVKLQV